MGRATLTIIVGPGGAGKTTKGKELAARGADVLFSPDVTLFGCDTQRAGFGKWPEVVARLLGGSDCVVDESHLTNEGFRDEFIRFCQEHLPEVNRRWVFVEDDQNAMLRCINNVYYDKEVNGRDELSRYRAVQDQTRIYSIPETSEFSGKEKIDVGYPDNDRKGKFSSLDKAYEWLDEQIDRLK